MNRSILASVMFIPFPHNLKIAGSNSPHQNVSQGWLAQLISTKMKCRLRFLLGPSFIIFFRQFSQSDLPPLKPLWGEAPGRDPNPGRSDLVAGTLTTWLPHLTHLVTDCSDVTPHHFAKHTHTKCQMDYLLLWTYYLGKCSNACVVFLTSLFTVEKWNVSSIICRLV